jgi:heme-degrading monooxygenase HmoA
MVCRISARLALSLEAAMFLLQEILRVRNTRQTEAITRLNWIHSLMKPHPGFMRGAVARFLGNPTDYLILRMWDSGDAYRAFRQTEDGQNYPKSRPEGLYEAVPVGREWELRIDSPGSVPGDYMVRSIYRVTPENASEFIENRRRHDALALQVAGTASLQTFQCLDKDSEHSDTFLCLARRTDRDAYNAYLESSQSAEYRAGNRRGLYSTVSTECYEVVDEVTP